MVAGLAAPWFGLHLRRGNSLIGARRAVYRRSQVADKSWLGAVPRDVPLDSLADDSTADRIGGDVGGGIHHFLLPADGWGAAADAKEAVRTRARTRPSSSRAGAARSRPNPPRRRSTPWSSLAHRVEALWQIAYQRLQHRRAGDPPVHPDLGGRRSRQSGGDGAARADRGGPRRPERRLPAAAPGDGRLVRALVLAAHRDIDDRDTPTDRRVAAADAGPVDRRAAGAARPQPGHCAGRTTRRQPDAERRRSSWDELGDAEELDLASPEHGRSTQSLQTHPWLQSSASGSPSSRASSTGTSTSRTVFAQRRLRPAGRKPAVGAAGSDVDALLAEGDPWWELTVKPSQALIAPEAPGDPGAAWYHRSGDRRHHRRRCQWPRSLGPPPSIPHLAGLQPDLYRCFMEQTWRHGRRRGTVGLIHPETHFTDEKAGTASGGDLPAAAPALAVHQRAEALRDRASGAYGVHVYGAARAEPAFLMATSLYHPDTVTRSWITTARARARAEGPRRATGTSGRTRVGSSM